jgi:protein KTI12
MPCLVLTGHPCVGKTEFAKKLGERALKHPSGLISAIEIVNEEGVCVDQTKSECYATSFAEKSTRSSLKAKVDRSLRNSKTLVICDSMNYIKGYRYELHCLSKAAQQKHGVVWILNSQAMEWNQKRSEEKQDYYFTDSQMKELIQRYEPPDVRNRWDKPLWRVDLTPSTSSSNSDALHGDEAGGTVNAAAQAALEKSVYNMHDLSEAITTDAAAAPLPKASTTSATSTFTKKEGAGSSSFKRRVRPSAGHPKEQSQEDIAVVAVETAAVTEALAASSKLEGVPKKAQTVEEQIDSILNEFLLNIAPLKEGMSTRQNVNAQSNVLHQVDSLTLQVCNNIVAAQQAHPGSYSTITLEQFGESIRLKCHRLVPLTELKRLRKQYIRWVTKIPPDDTSSRGLVVSFVRHLEAQIEK